MIYVSDIEQAMDLHLGTTEEDFYTADKRRDAIYRSIVLILQRYDIPQYVKKTTLTFASGACLVPTDCLRPLYLKNDQRTEYERLDYEMFDNRNSYTYTMEYDQVTNLETMYIYQPDSTTLDFRYIIAPPRITSGTQELYFKDWWIDAISMYAVSFLHKNARNFGASSIAQEEALTLCASAWQNDRSRIGGEQEQRLRSKFETQPMFGYSWSPYFSSTVQVMTPNVTWATTNSDIQGFANMGYFADSSDQVIVTLPATASVGDYFAVAYQGTGGWKLEQNQGQQIVFGDQETTVGVTGYVESIAPGDNIVLVCQTETNIWEVLSAVGNLTYV
jgi:hypothetical protein